MSGPELLAWFDASRRRLIAVFADLDPGQRVPWFGPPMSAASSLTARIMETWAHGQDVADTLGVQRQPTARLRHIAHIGVRASRTASPSNGRERRPSPVRVELTGPGGAIVELGCGRGGRPGDRPRLDFCLLVTQRRHQDDVAIVAQGGAAVAWLAVAQAFAGPPGSGRQPLGPVSPRRSGATA